ncbi:DUF1501 domain-containing protein [Minwuia sp.]|uniref:DUF1501 domain-containing protein n=1 Tax=Minwuia sp. TaxID=2493630 RepID=UPI003A900451
MARLSRRSLLAAVTASGALTLAPRSAALAGTQDRRFLLIILRGGLDGLSALPPVGDPAFASHRPESLAARPLSLAGQSDFALHHALPALQRIWNAGQLIGLHAVGTPYRDRSHFDAQNVLESGYRTPRGSANGWLNRALVAMGGETGLGMAVGPRAPLVLTGPAPVGSWSPNTLPGTEDSTLERIAALWANDPLLATHIEQALDQQTMTANLGRSAGDVRKTRRSIVPLLKGAGDLLANPAGPRLMALDNAGWDTHVRIEGNLSRKLTDLNEGLESLISRLQPVWQQTAVLMVTEFGRTVALNGNAGTDHGTGGAAFLFGGAVNGGRIISDWPGLSQRDLLDGRDLRPTVDLRHVFRSTLHDHMQLSRSALDDTVFPDDLGHRGPLRDLFRS